MHHDHEKMYDKLKVTKKDGVATLSGEITLAAIEFHKSEALKELKKEFKVPGFRPGHVPEEVIKKHISETELFDTGAQDALKHAYPHILEDEGIHPLTYPRVEVTKFAIGNPLEFTIKVGIAPEFSLPKYTELAKSVPVSPTETKDEEIAQIIKELEATRSTKEVPFVLTDETAKTIGKFESLEDLKTKLRTHLGEEKEQEAKMKRREEIGKLLLEKTPINFSSYWEEDERAAILGDLEDHASRHKISKEELLKGYKKTEEEFLNEELEHRRKSQKMKMILDAIAEKEDIKLTEEDVEREAMQLRTYYAETDHEQLKEVAKTAMRREKALELLESYK